MAKSPSQIRTPERTAASPRRAGSRRAAVKSVTAAPAEPDRDDLERELAAAKARIAELEAAHKDVLDRIAWAIDSLHSLMEQSPD